MTEIISITIAAICGALFGLLIILYGMFRCVLSNNKNNGICLLCFAERRILTKQGKIVPLVIRHKA